MGNGKRGTRAEGPFESPTPLAGHMPAKSPRTQGDFGPSSKRGTHDSDFSGNTTKKPTECMPSVSDEGCFDYDGDAAKIIESGKHDPRRSHS